MIGNSQPLQDSIKFIEITLELDVWVSNSPIIIVYLHLDLYYMHACKIICTEFQNYDNYYLIGMWSPLAMQWYNKYCYYA